MKTIGMFEGKTRFSALVEAARNGETIIITKSGTPVAQIGPLPAADGSTSDAERAIEELLAEPATLGGLSVRELIDEGRR
jgi:prevent-host-death family protein